MALRELICGACGHTWEVVRQDVLRDEDKVCPVCGSTEVRHKFSSFLRTLADPGVGCSPTADGGFG